MNTQYDSTFMPAELFCVDDCGAAVEEVGAAVEAVGAAVEAVGAAVEKSISPSFGTLRVSMSFL